VIETIENTLKAKGVELTSPVENQGFGRRAIFKAPGELVRELYQPNDAKGDSSYLSLCA
tara:strand:- start:160 stop:336 length:177 start_codon:yes stop_codon:yes gene_type:complete